MYLGQLLIQSVFDFTENISLRLIFGSGTVQGERVFLFKVGQEFIHWTTIDNSHRVFYAEDVVCVTALLQMDKIKCVLISF